MVWLKKPITENLSVQAGVGPYVSMNTVYAGAGYYYASAAPSNWGSGDTDVSAFAGQPQTTREKSDFAKSFQVEVRKLQTSEVAYSVSIISEGDSGVTDRKGVTAQVWYVIPTKDDKWTFSVGAGPYIAHDQREQAGEKTTAMILGSLEFGRKLTKTVDLMFRWNRGVSFRNKGQDSFYLGIRKHLK